MKLEKRRLHKQFYRLYEKEQRTYIHFYSAVLSRKDINKIIKILDNKYKIFPKIIYYKEESPFGAWANWRKNTIRFNTNYYLNIELVAHEYTHLICGKKKIRTVHSYKFYQELKKTIIYLENKLEFKIL